MPAFIETQFPIARLSAEFYKERKAVSGQTLTGLGKWWGRKPLILVRASILGMLMPASDNPKKDREIFLKILTMDDNGAWERCKGDIPAAAWRDAAPAEIQEEYFGVRGFKQGLTDEEKEEICVQIWESLTEKKRQSLDAQRRRPINDRSDFDALPYPERIKHCDRPEEVDGPSEAAWSDINRHLDTTATCLSELVQQLGHRSFGHTPCVGDSFCGGGSIPFEAARIGCNAFGSDLNPVAGLLTWASLNLLGGGKEAQEQAMKAQTDAFKAADEQVTAWGIEHNESGERADAFLYCVEVKPEGCDYFIPLAPSWVVANKTRVVVKWHRDRNSEHLEPKVVSVPPAEFDLFNDKDKKKGATVEDSRVIDPFDRKRSWSLEALRGPEGLRRWTNEDVVPRVGDVFRERLYCIRWINAEGKRRYAAPDAADLARENKVLKLLRDKFADWQREGFIPSKAIPGGGDKTEEPIRTRGWTDWHHLFTPRQLLTLGLIAKAASEKSNSQEAAAFCLLTIARIANWNSRLCRWLQPQGGGIGGGVETFYNQALNPLVNYSVRPVHMLRSALPQIRYGNPFKTAWEIKLIDARDINTRPC